VVFAALVHVSLSAPSAHDSAPPPPPPPPPPVVCPAPPPKPPPPPPPPPAAAAAAVQLPRMHVRTRTHSRAHVRRLHTTSRYIDSVVNEKQIMVVTERVTPLAEHLSEDRNVLAISWGLHQIAKAIGFLVDSQMTHCNICLSSIFVDGSGEWKVSIPTISLASLMCLCQDE
jgi:ribosomal protein S15P/S13E